MKVSSVLLVTCLLGLCHCRRSKLPTDGLHIEVLDDYVEDEIVTSEFVEETRKRGPSGQRQMWDLSNGTVHEVEHRPSSTRRRNAGKITVEESGATTHSGDTTTMHTPSPDDDESLSLDGNTANLTVPEDATATKIVRGSDTVWTFSSGEMFEYAKAYFDKENSPNLLLS
ncbi:signal peptide-containing protein [Theileria equi strain WA]|uniref:Signal peptide-containing protein n=1 Tax=Theileria equi strain WA TaxID=1537102 RepID=L0AWZ2_THEEQ|nr:signal peptide-containing protein [Theileria equi strain WA]AFZ80112.1 signal peptide-containing protein [Theileria equi strain WA]|eukprot:XP_004829778.1 signal peptide-containing protein [Theileria equi strain WA]